MLVPPTVVEELSVCSTAIRLKNQVHRAKIEVYVDGVANPIVDATADWPDQWFEFRAGVTLVEGQTVRARQTLNGDASGLSTDGAVVQTRATTQPYFVAPLVGCASIAVVEGFTPGATVTVSASNGAQMGTAVAAGSRVVVDLTRAVANGEVLTARTSACGAPAGSFVYSLPAEPMGLGEPRLVTPVLDPVFPCQRVLRFTGVRVGARVNLRRDDGSIIFWTGTAPELLGRIDPPLRPNETVEYWQEPPPRCELFPSAEGRSIASAGPPGPPQIVTHPCPGSKFLEVSGLVPSSTVNVMADGVVVCTFEAAEPATVIDLGSVVLTPGQKLTVAQALCGVFGPASPVPSWVTVAPLAAAPAMPEQLFQCGTTVRVSGIAGASRISLMSDRLKGRIGYAFTEDSVVDIPVSPPLIFGDRIYAYVTGCAPGTGAREVESFGDLLPFLVIPPHQGDRSVHVKAIMPGAHIDVVINGRWAGGATPGGTDARIPVDHAMKQGENVVVSQRLCSQVRSVGPVVVQAEVEVKWSRPTGLALDDGNGHFMSGRVNAAILLGAGRAVLGTEEAGVWIATPTGTALPLSMDWTSPQIHSLCRGTRGNDHVYCGTENGIMETDTSKPVPMLAWIAVNGIPAAGGPGGTVSDLLIAGGRLYAATNSGLWWSALPASAGAGYAWASDPLVNQLNVLALCEGPNGTIVAYARDATGVGRFMRGAWTGGTVAWTNVTPGATGPVADNRLTTVAMRMRNGHVTSCPRDRSRMAAALEDTDNAWLAVLRSDDGGLTWTIPYADANLVYFKPGALGGTVDMGYQAERNLRVAFHPSSRDKVLLAGRRSGLLGSTDAGVTWDTTNWPGVTDGSFHADCLCVTFAPDDPTGNTLLVGSDGGAFLSTDFGKKWDTSYNRTLTTLMFDQRWWSSAPALSTSDAYPGLVVGAFQDNGKGYLSADGEPWRELNQTGDGERALFVTGDIVMNKGNDEEDLKWARWDGAKFVDEVTLEPPGYPAGQSFAPFIARIPYPGRTDAATKAPMIAVAGDNQPSGNVWGLFDRGAGHNPHSERLYWLKLGTVPFPIASVASLTGRTVLVGSLESRPAPASALAHLFVLDSLTATVVETTMPAQYSASPRWITICSGTVAMVLVGNNILRTTDFMTWTQVPTGINTTLNVLAVDRGDDPVRLVLGGSDGVWSSRDLGATWTPTKGQPRHPQANHLEVVEYASGQRAAYMGTWNWSVWRAFLA